MKTAFTTFFLLLAAVCSGQQILDFESVTIDSFLNGSDGSGGFEFDGVRLPNDYNPAFGSWRGWALSAATDTLTEGFTNQYSAISGGGAEGSTNYAVAFGATNVLYLTGEAAGSTVSGVEVNNGTYPYLSMLNGDSFTKQFGGVTGDDPDFFLLTIKGYSGGALLPDSVDFYLADYRFADNAQDYIVKDWTFVDLSTLGPVDSLAFSFTSTDVGTFGINTPTYFMLDNLTYERSTSTRTPPSMSNTFQLAPNPTSDYVTVYPKGGHLMRATVFALSGEQLVQRSIPASGGRLDLSAFPAGSYVLRVEGPSGVETRLVIRR